MQSNSFDRTEKWETTTTRRNIIIKSDRARRAAGLDVPRVSRERISGVKIPLANRKVSEGVRRRRDGQSDGEKDERDERWDNSRV